jgi:hypothetical protein
MEAFTEEKMRSALRGLDEELDREVSLIIGGGGAMILGHQLPLATADIDAVPKNMDLFEIDVMIKSVAKKQHLPVDWLNPYFATFGHTLPQDYDQRLIEVFSGRQLKAFALGLEEMLIMKCFAGRQKDIVHSRALIKKGANTEFVEKHIEKLIQERIPGSEKALDFLDELVE